MQKAQVILDDGLNSVETKNAFAPTPGPDPEIQTQSALLDTTLPDLVHLRLLATSDLHVNILPYDYYTGCVTNRLGFARTAGLIVAARGEVENCLLFDNGDFLHGSPLGDYIAQPRGMADGDRHPMITAMNALSYDAGTLGNHEFNYGLGFLKTSLAGAEFPIVAANVYLSDGPLPRKSLVPPYVILNRTVIDMVGTKHPIKIGVIGFTPPQILIWDHQHLNGKLTSQDIVDAATAYVPQMQEEGVDLIIALSHSGIGSGQATVGQENASTALARVAGIDVVIAGHSHLVFPSDDFHPSDDIDPVLGTLCGKPAVMPGFYGSHLGVVDLYLSLEGGRYKLMRHKSEARPIYYRGALGNETALVESHCGIVQMTAAVHQQTLDWTSIPIGDTALPLHSFFALLAETSALQLVASAQARHVEKMLAGTPLAHLPVLASVAPFKAGGRGGPENYTNVPVGKVMRRHASDLYIHPNTSAALRLTGAEIQNWLEYAAGIFNQIPAGSVDLPLINSDFPSFNFDMIFGLSFQIDLARPARFDLHGNLVNPQNQRITGLTYQGQPLEPMAYFAIATNSYRVSANAAHLPLDVGRLIYQSTQANLDLVLRYFAAGKINLPAKPSNRRFAPMHATTVIFDTSPKALPHTPELHDMHLEPIGLTPTGFLRFRLHL